MASKSRFGVGLLIGTVIGGVAALFLSPKSGKQNRREFGRRVNQLKKLLHEKEIDTRAEEIFGKATDEAKNIYIQAKEWLIEELAKMEEAVEHIDQEKYKKAVDGVVKKVQKVAKKESKDIEKLKKHLLTLSSRIFPSKA